MDDNGTITYARNGQFQLDKSGYIVNANGAKLTGYVADSNGVLSTGAPAELNINTADLTPKSTTAVSALLNLDSRKSALPSAGFNMNDPATFHDSTSVSVYDSLGNPHTLQTYFVKTAAGAWDVFASNDGTLIGPIGALNFQGDGSINTATTTLPIAVPLTVTTGAASPFSVDVDFTGTTQFGSTFSVNTLNQDGFASGRLAGFSTAADGTIVGRYTNGQSATLGQVVLANFTNPNGLQPLGNNVWAETSASGSPLVGAPNSGGLGVLQSSAVEDSNVDLTAELVNMITAQRVYQANAQTIKTQDQVLQTLVNLR
jgi:flagellar hook protein FlgE